MGSVKIKLPLIDSMAFWFDRLRWLIQRAEANCPSGALLKTKLACVLRQNLTLAASERGCVRYHRGSTPQEEKGGIGNIKSGLIEADAMQ